MLKVPRKKLSGLHVILTFVPDFVGRSRLLSMRISGRERGTAIPASLHSHWHLLAFLNRSFPSSPPHSAILRLYRLQGSYRAATPV